MHLQVTIASLLLLLTGAVVSSSTVRGVEGQPVTLPCTYSTTSGVTTMCWGRGACPSSWCTEEIVSTDGSRVIRRRNMRYDLKGNIRHGNVSLTIEKAVQADSGRYCCRVEHPGWFNDMKLTLSLEIKPAGTTSLPTSPRVSTFAPPTPTPTQNLKPASSPSPIPTETQSTTPLETSTSQSTSSTLCSCQTDGNGTVTQSSDGPWHTNQTRVLPAKNSWTITSKLITIIVSIIIAVLLILLFVKIAKKYLCLRNKLQQLSMVFVNRPPIGALQNAAEMRNRAADNIYIVEDNPYVVD
ncbi:hepatitis A virus cellular receptor 1 isoform X1 [Talpa occidentalis]|uniref:hepatitis A virus cellular receptor 1 isoform X1 n=1 Tax=Talpa occidentalis TaxID=50954 RepID=UPI00188E4106|nr:hepatitis A virus cellular receptor 1 isoform X1 [Talpa occidentalis]